MVIPHNIDTQSIETEGFCHLDAMFPILEGDPTVVHFGSKYFGGKGLLIWGVEGRNEEGEDGMKEEEE